MKKLFITILMATLLQVSALAQNRKEFSIGVFFESTAGRSSSQSFDFANLFVKAFEEDSGYRMNLIKYPSLEDVERAFAENKVDGAWLFSFSAIELLDLGYGIYPWFTYTVNNERKQAFCLWRKTTDRASNISAAAGKTFLNNKNFYNHILLTTLRIFLFENGIDKPLWKTFRSFMSVSSFNSAFIALAMGKADYVWNTEDSATVLKLINPGIVSDLKHDFCTKNISSRSGVVFNSKRLNEAEYRQLNAAMTKFIKKFHDEANNYPSLKALKQYAKMVAVRLVPADMDEFKKDLELYRMAKVKGWDEEAKYIEKIMNEAPMGEPIEIKPDLEFCKRQCADKGSACIVECLE